METPCQGCALNSKPSNFASGSAFSLLIISPRSFVTSAAQRHRHDYRRAALHELLIIKQRRILAPQDVGKHCAIIADLLGHAGDSRKRINCSSVYRFALYVMRSTLSGGRRKPYA